MIFYLRDDKNRTVADIECYINKEDDIEYIELRSVVLLVPFAHIACHLEGKQKHEFIQLMEMVQELRGWLNEDYFKSSRNTPEEFDNVIQALRKILQNVSRRTNLYLIED